MSRIFLHKGRFLVGIFVTREKETLGQSAKKVVYLDRISCLQAGEKQRMESIVVNTFRAPLKGVLKRRHFTGPG